MSARPVTRSASRRRALEILHAADVIGTEPIAPDDDAFAAALVSGVTSVRAELDKLIAGASEHWTLERMPVVDRNALRIGVYELVHTDTPTGVVVDEAVSLVKLLSTEGSTRFVNGILSHIARDARSH